MSSFLPISPTRGNNFTVEGRRDYERIIIANHAEIVTEPGLPLFATSLAPLEVLKRAKIAGWVTARLGMVTVAQGDEQESLIDKKGDESSTSANQHAEAVEEPYGNTGLNENAVIHIGKKIEKFLQSLPKSICRTHIVSRRQSKWITENISVFFVLTGST